MNFVKLATVHSHQPLNSRVGVEVLSHIMARRKENERAHQNNDDSDSNPNDEVEEEPNFDDPEGYEDDISEQGTVDD